MSGIWVVSGVLGLGVFLMLVLPVLRARAADDRSAYALEVYRAQLGEIERDREGGLIGGSEFEEARREIQRRIVKVAPELGSTDRITRRGKWIGLLAAVGAPAFAAALYLAVGSPDLPDQPLAMRQPAPSSPQTEAVGPDVAAMVQKLEARLAEAPDDFEGWMLLGRSKAVLGNFDEAVVAYGQAARLQPDNPGALSNLSEMLIRANGGIVTEEILQVLDRVLALTPNDPQAIFYVGLHQEQSGLPREAVQTWLGLLASSPADAPWRETVTATLASVADANGIDVSEIPTGTASPEAAALAEMQALSPEERDQRIREMVEGLQERLDAYGGNAQEWARLARAREVLGDLPRARASYARAAELAPQNVEILLSWAATHLGPPDGQGLPSVTEEAATLYQQVAEMAPGQPEPAWFLGIQALQNGDEAMAKAYWQAVLERIPADHPDYEAIKVRLGNLDREQQ